MEEMGWSWSDLQATPFIVLEEIYERLVARAKWTKVKKEQDADVNTQFGSKR